jgi:hypothetical protein
VVQWRCWVDGWRGALRKAMEPVPGLQQRHASEIRQASGERVALRKATEPVPGLQQRHASEMPVDGWRGALRKATEPVPGLQQRHASEIRQASGEGVSNLFFM